jgi:uncharacterized protein (TIGR00255 family)
MRMREGAALVSALKNSLDSIESTVARLRTRKLQLIEKERNTLRERIQKVWALYPPPAGTEQGGVESRLAQELALSLERGDIEEELIRLAGHVEHFRATLEAGGPVGKKLEFLLQELHREINTLGSKSQDLEIGTEVVDLKVHLEQLREQVANLE